MASPLIVLCADEHAALASVTKFPVFDTVTETAAAELDYHIDIMSRNIATADITKIFILPEIRTDFFWHL